MPDQEPDIVIHFLPLPDDVQVSVRIRALLKMALRRLALKCVRVEGLPEEKQVDERGEQSG